MMRSVSATCVTVLLLLLPVIAAAQTAAETIRASVKTGQRVIVTADPGEEVKGRLIDVAPDALTIRAGGDHITVPYAQITRIQKQRDRLYNGMLIGLGVGAVYGAKAFSDADPPPPCGPFALFCAPAPSLPVYLGVWGGLGTAVGAAVDALIVQRDRTIFGWADSARVTVSPHLSRGVKGVRVSASW